MFRDLRAAILAAVSLSTLLASGASAGGREDCWEGGRFRDRAVDRGGWRRAGYVIDEYGPRGRPCPPGFRRARRSERRFARRGWRAERVVRVAHLSEDWGRCGASICEEERPPLRIRRVERVEREVRIPEPEEEYRPTIRVAPARQATPVRVTKPRVSPARSRVPAK